VVIAHDDGMERLMLQHDMCASSSSASSSSSSSSSSPPSSSVSSSGISSGVGMGGTTTSLVAAAGGGGAGAGGAPGEELRQLLGGWVFGREDKQDPSFNVHQNTVYCPFDLVMDADCQRIFISDMFSIRVAVPCPLPPLAQHMPPLTGPVPEPIVDADSAEQYSVHALAGGELPGFDDGVGLQASFSFPQALHYSALTDTLYVVDAAACAIRSVVLAPLRAPDVHRHLTDHLIPDLAVIVQDFLCDIVHDDSSQKKTAVKCVMALVKQNNA
jgi:hypothetical protein